MGGDCVTDLCCFGHGFTKYLDLGVYSIKIMGSSGAVLRTLSSPNDVFKVTDYHMQREIGARSALHQYSYS
jgi:hypothetical protein